MSFLLFAATAAATDYAQQAKERMKLSFDLDSVEEALAAPAASPAAARAIAVPVVRRLPLEPNSALRHVLVLRDRAVVTRVRTVDLGRGAQRVRFEGLPLGLDTATLAAELRAGGARVVGAELVAGVGDVEETERIAGVRKEAQDLTLRLGAVRDRIEALLVQRAYLDQALLSGAGEGRPAPTLDAVKGAYTWLGDTQRELAARLREQETSAEELGETLEPLLVKLQDPRATGLTVRVDVDVARAGPVELGLRYGVLGASWTPAYAARLDPGSAQVRFETQALVRQTTGEVWNDAELELSTATPVVGGAAPTLGAWVLDEAGVNPASLQVGGGVSQGSGARVFPVEGRRTIAGDGSESRIPLEARDVAARFSLQTVPRIAPEVFRGASVPWTGEAPLLPGVVTSFVGGDYVGSASVGAVAPGEELGLGFGVEDQLRVTRTLASRRVEHLVGGRTRTTVTVQTRVRNFGKDARAVRLLDQIPVSQVDRISVALLQTSLPAATVPDLPAGVLAWDLALAPGQETSVELSFSVTAPKELQARVYDMLM